MIDTDSLRAKTDLLALAGRDATLRHVAGTAGGEWAGPCPFCGGRDRFRVQPQAPAGGRWLCRKCGEGKWQDVIAYVMRREDCDFAQACEQLGGILPATRPGSAVPAVPVAGGQQSGPPPAQWQAHAQEALEACVSTLWSPDGEDARAWLLGRGLADDTLRTWRLGYCQGRADEWRSIAGLSVPCGIVIPCEADGALWYLKTRRATGRPKYVQVKGGRPALFGAEALRGRDVAVICEGEFDALLLAQECGDLCGVATCGSASGRTDLAAWGRYLLPVRRLLVAYDLDDAGSEGARQWESLTARAQRVTVPRVGPDDKDISDFWRAGGNLRAWLAFELARRARPGDAEKGGNRPMTRPEPEHEARPAAAPICRQSLEIEEAWWARVFAERGIPDPCGDEREHVARADDAAAASEDLRPA